MSRKIEISAAVVEEMGRRRHGIRRWKSAPLDTQQAMRARIVEAITEVKRAERAVEALALKKAW